MKSRFNPLTLYPAGFLLAIGQVVYFYPHLPERIASHFGPSGQANGWMSRDSFMTFYGVMLLITAATLAGVGAIMGVVPDDMINLPNKEYWLAPERREETRRTLAAQMHWFGAATMALLIAMMQLTFQANLTTQPNLDNRASLLVVAYLIFTLVWTAGLILRFARKN